jgi:hypothetical protein
MRARSIPDSLIDIRPQTVKSNGPEDVTAITISATAFRKTLIQVKAFEKTKTAISLNKKGYAKKSFSIGDKIGFYLPPSAEQAKQLKKNPKHCLQWHGPAIITHSLSRNGTTWRFKYRGSFYERHVKHMHKWTKTNPTTAQVIDNTIAIGTYIAYRYTNSGTHYHVAKITDITDGVATIWHLYTRSDQIKTAIWKPLYILPRTNRLTLKKPKVLNVNNQKLTSTITVLSLQTIIIATNIAMKNKQITAASIDVLHDTNLKHHIYKKTWLQKDLTIFDMREDNT